MMMFQPGSGWRPGVAIPGSGLQVWVAIIFGALFALYLLLGAASIFALFFIVGFSPFWLWIPLGFLLGWGFANRPVGTAVGFAVGLLIVAVLLWKYAIGPQFVYAGDPHSLFRLYILPIMLLAIPCFCAWLAATIALHVRSRPRLAPWWAITLLGVVFSFGTLWIVKPFSLPLWNRYETRHLAEQQRDKVAADRICAGARQRSEIHDVKVLAICQADGKLPPILATPPGWK